MKDVSWTEQAPDDAGGRVVPVVRRRPVAAWAYTVFLPGYVLVWMYRIQREATMIRGSSAPRSLAIGRPAAYVVGLGIAVGSYQANSNVVAVIGLVVALFAALGVARAVDRATGDVARRSWLARHVVLVPAVLFGMLFVHVWVPLVQRRMNRWIDVTDRAVVLVPRPRSVLRRPPRSWVRSDAEVIDDPVHVSVPLSSRWSDRPPVVVPVLVAASVAMFGWLWLQLGRSWAQADLDRLGALSLHDLHDGAWSDLVVMNVLHLNEFHLGLNIAAMVAIGVVLEQWIGRRELATLTVLGAAGAALGSLAWLDPSLVSVGASGIIASWVGASIALDPRGRSDVGRIGRLLLLYGVIDYISSTHLGSGVLAIDFGSHLGGLIAGFTYVLMRVATSRIRIHAVRFAARTVPVAVAFVAGLVIVAEVRPNVVSLPSDPSQQVEATATRAEVEAYIDQLLPVFARGLAISRRLAILRIDLYEYPGRRSRTIESIERAGDDLQDTIDELKAVDVIDGMQDVHDLYVHGLIEERRAANQLVAAIHNEDLVQVEGAIQRSSKSAVPVSEGTELLMARARLVQADTSRYGRMTERVGRSFAAVMERDQRLYREGVYSRSPF